MKVLLLSAVFLASMSVFAQDRDDKRDRDRQHVASQAYYDSKHRDWHQWNDQEEQSYQRYAKEHHEDADFSKASERQQQQYWNWRHKHPDSH